MITTILAIVLVLGSFNIVYEFKKKKYINFGFSCFAFGVIFSYLVTLIFR